MTATDTQHTRTNHQEGLSGSSEMSGVARPGDVLPSSPFLRPSALLALGSVMTPAPGRLSLVVAKGRSAEHPAATASQGFDDNPRA